MAGEGGGGHDAGHDASRATAQPSRDGNIGLDIKAHGEGLLAPLAQRVDKGDVHEVALVLEFLGATGDLQALRALKGEVRVQ